MNGIDDVSRLVSWLVWLNRFNYLFLVFFFWLLFNLLSIKGVGVILVTVSGAAWRMTAPGSTQCLGIGSNELGRCGRRPGCSGRGLHGFLYPEFQHRPPPPTYQASMQEYRLRWVINQQRNHSLNISFEQINEKLQLKPKKKKN